MTLCNHLSYNHQSTTAMTYVKLMHCSHGSIGSHTESLTLVLTPRTLRVLSRTCTLQVESLSYNQTVRAISNLPLSCCSTRQRWCIGYSQATILRDSEKVDYSG